MASKQESFPSTASHKSFPPERYFIDLKNDQLSANEKRHIAEYKFAASFFAGPNKILDGACGCGYGSNILSATGASVISVDLNKRAIDYAITKYKDKNIDSGEVDFRQADLTTLSIRDDSLDGVVSLETLEHIDIGSCETYLKNVGRWTKPGGILIASSPMLRYRNGKPYIATLSTLTSSQKNNCSRCLRTCYRFQLTFFIKKKKYLFP